MTTKSVEDMTPASDKRIDKSEWLAISRADLAKLVGLVSPRHAYEAMNLVNQVNEANRAALKGQA